MELQQAVHILKKHNEWRRGSDIEMIQPSKIGIAIDVIVEAFENKCSSSQLINDSKGIFNNLKHKGWDWNSFFNGYLECFSKYYNK